MSALAGVVFFALIVWYASLISGAPAATDPGRDVIAWVSRHQGRLQWAAVVIGIAMSAALIWVSGLYAALRRAEGGRGGLAVSALAGGVLAAAGTSVGALVLGVTANRIGDLDPAAARVWWTAWLLSFGVTLLGLLVLVGATSAIGLRGLLFARWFAIAGVVLAAASAVGAGTIGYANDVIQVIAGLAIVLDSVWILLVSVFLWRKPALALP